MDARLIGSALGLLLLAGVLVLVSGGEPRIVDVQVDHHDRYDRVVLELSDSASIVRRPETQWRDLIVDLGVQPRARWEELRTESARVGTLVLEETPAGVRLSGMRRERRLRVFQLLSPPRLVVDFADRFDMVLSVPQGAMLVPTVALPGPELAFSTTVGGEPSSAEDAEWMLDTQPTAAGSLGDAPQRAHESLSAAVTEESVSVEQRLHGVLEAEASSAPASARRAPWAAWIAGIALALVLGSLLMICLRKCLRVWGVLRDSARSVEAGALAGATEVGPEQLTEVSVLLARRHDEEVSARMQLEERVLHLQEEVRQLRDGLTRLARRGDPRA